MNKKISIIVVILILLCGGVGYYLFTRPQKVDNPTHQLHLGLNDDEDTSSKDDSKKEEKDSDKKEEGTSNQKEDTNQTQNNETVSQENNEPKEESINQEPGVYDNGDGSISIILDEGEETYGE